MEIANIFHEQPFFTNMLDIKLTERGISPSKLQA